MGYNQHNAGMHLIHHDEYKYSLDEEYVREEEIKNNNSDGLLISMVKKYNFMSILEYKGSSKQCLCGGKLNYYSNLPIKYRDGEQMCTTYLDGKKCVDCGRLFFVKDLLRNKMKEELTKKN